MSDSLGASRSAAHSSNYENGDYQRRQTQVRTTGVGFLLVGVASYIVGYKILMRNYFPKD